MVLKVTSTCICGSDLHLYLGYMPGTPSSWASDRHFVYRERFTEGLTVLVLLKLPQTSYLAGKGRGRGLLETRFTGCFDLDPRPGRQACTSA